MSNEVYALDLDTDFLWHLAKPESVRYLVGEKVSSKLLEDEYVARVYEWQLAHFREHHKPATAAVLEHEFEDANIEEPETVINDLVERLRARYLQNNGRDVLVDLKNVYKEDPSQLAVAVAREGRRLLDLTVKRGNEYGTGDADLVMSVYDERKLRGRGPSFGFDELDDNFYGYDGVTFTIGPPKRYKSWMGGVKPTVKNVMEGKNVHLYSLELPAEDTDMRILCMAANVPFWKYLRGAFDHHDLNALRQAAEDLDSLGTYRVIKPPPGQRDIETMFGRAADRGADLVIVDQLQYVEVDRGPNRGNVALGEGDHTWYWQALNKARDLADEIPISFMHQFNRTVMFSEEMPEMQQAKGAAAIEEVATLALGLWSNKDMRQSNRVEYGTLASRNYGYPSWLVQVELSKGCSFEVLERTDE